MMQFLKKLIDKKSPFSFFVRFLLCFFVLYYFYPFYRGITGAGGKLYSAYLDEHFNLVKGLTGFLTGSARVILEAMHYHIVQRNYHTLKIDYSRGISVNPSCLGWAVMSFWVAFVFANPGTWKHKVKWILGGVASIILLNISRIVLIVISNHRQWKFMASIDPHTMFNILSYGCIFLLIFWFTRVQKKYEGARVAKKTGYSLEPA